MKILMLTTKFTHNDGSLWLTSELANQFVKEGHSVTVFNLEWSGSNYSIGNVFDSINLVQFKALRIKIPIISVALRWFFSSIIPSMHLLQMFLSGKKFDLLISFSPCTAFYATLPLARKMSFDACLVYWDFFPIHNQEISGKAPKFSIPLLKFIEKKLVSLFPRIGCMSVKNIDFFNSYFGEIPNQKRSIIPVWTSYLYSNLSIKKNLCNDVTFVFGGQLVEGRGVIELCKAAILANRENSSIKLTICGSGFLSEKIIELQKLHPNVIQFMGSLSRLEYLKVLNNSNIGVVATVGNVQIPTFPSKCLDYMACELPILAAVESSSDFGEIIEKNHIGVSCLASDINSIKDGILDLASKGDELKKMGKNGNIYLGTHHSVQHAAKLIIGE